MKTRAAIAFKSEEPARDRQVDLAAPKAAVGVGTHEVGTGNVAGETSAAYPT